jgi:HAMP domain-containing protein
MFGPSRRVARRTARRTSRRQAAFRDMEQGYYDAPEPAPQHAPAPAAEGADYVEELQKLAKLKEQGILSEEEFQAKKKQILGI